MISSIWDISFTTYGAPWQAKDVATEEKPIVIIEDDVDIHTQLRAQVIPRVPKKFIFYKNSAPLFNSFRLDRVSLYIIDINLPDIGGITLAKFIRLRESIRSPIIFVSSDPDGERKIAETFPEDYGMHFLMKPLDSKKISKLIIDNI